MTSFLNRIERLEQVFLSFSPPSRSAPKSVKLPYKFKLKRPYIYEDPYIGKILCEEGDEFWEIKDQPTYYSNGVCVLHGALLWTSRDVWEPHFN